MSKEEYTPPPTNRESYTPPTSASAAGVVGQSFAAVAPRPPAAISYLCAGMFLCWTFQDVDNRLRSIQLYRSEGADPVPGMWTSCNVQETNKTNG
jgi:hypothetical protein